MRYEFRIASVPSPTVRAAFPELTVRHTRDGSNVLFGPVEDQATLHEIITRFGDLAIEIVEIRQLPD